MASLRSMILKEKTGCVTAETSKQEIESGEFEGIRRILQLHTTIPVDASQVMNDVLELLRSKDNLDKLEESRIPCPKPPFHQMWLEAAMPDGVGRIGALVTRVDVPPEKDPVEAVPDSSWAFGAMHTLSHIPQIKDTIADIQRDQPSNMILILFCQEYSGESTAVFAGEYLYWLDAQGNWQNSRQLAWPPDYNDENERIWNKGRLHAFAVWALHTFGRLNCHNVKLVPAKDRASGKQNGKSHAPFSVWHEIVVEDPQLRSKQEAATPSGEKQEIRFHRVRGHYADYTKGSGLFGKYKVRIWVEQHARGNRELGEVVGSYSVQ